MQDKLMTYPTSCALHLGVKKKIPKSLFEFEDFLTILHMAPQVFFLFLHNATPYFSGSAPVVMVFIWGLMNGYDHQVLVTHEPCVIN